VAIAHLAAASRSALAAISSVLAAIGFGRCVRSILATGCAILAARGAIFAAISFGGSCDMFSMPATTRAIFATIGAVLTTCGLGLVAG
jgi:hypothetical protein